MQSRSNSNIKGIDVSHHNGAINWQLVSGTGVQFAFIKATEGTNFTDVALDANAKGAKSVGIKVGFYHYAHPENGNTPETEADYFVQQTKGYTCDLAYALDVEGNASGIGKEQLTAWCRAFLERVKALTGKPVVLYTGASFAKTYLGPALSAYPLWVAHYGVDTPMANAVWPNWSIFQYTSTGKVNGINSNVDVNVMEAAFFNQLTQTGTVPPVPVPKGEDNIKVVVNDKLAAYGRNVGGHVYLPLAQLGQALGKTVTWDNTAKIAYVDGKAVTDYKIADSHVYIGVRSAAELLGGTVSWDNVTKKVYFYHQ